MSENKGKVSTPETEGLVAVCAAGTFTEKELNVLPQPRFIQEPPTVEDENIPVKLESNENERYWEELTEKVNNGTCKVVEISEVVENYLAYLYDMSVNKGVKDRTDE